MPSLKVPQKIWPLLVPVFAIASFGIYVGLNHYHDYQKTRSDSVINFQPSFALPAGWIKEPHGPTTLFKFSEPRTDLVLRGSVNQVIADVNPTPDWDTEGIAKFFVDRTKESMPLWTAKFLRKYDTPTGNEFEVIRRSTKDRIVVTAYAVKGNTTLLITLFGKNRSKQFVDGNMDKLYGFLDSVALTQKDMSQM